MVLNMFSQQRRKQAGHTLVEVMVASIVLLMVSAGIMTGIIAALKAQANASDHYRATCIARNRIQHAKTISFNSYNAITENLVRVDQDGFYSSTGEFRRSTLVSVAGTNCMNVTVDVWYSVRPGVWSTEPVSVQTMIHTTMQL